MEKKDLIRKIGIYGGNFVIRPIGRLIDKSISLGNPYGAIAYGVLDIFRSATPNIKNNKYVRLFEAGGFAVYSLKTIVNLISLAQGDLDTLLEIPFNASMAFQIGKNTVSDYKGKSLKKDIIDIPQDFTKILDSFEVR